MSARHVATHSPDLRGLQRLVARPEKPDGAVWRGFPLRLLSYSLRDAQLGAR